MVKAKILSYLLTHSNPVTTAQLAKRFMRSQSHVRKMLNELKQEKQAVSITIGKTIYWKRIGSYEPPVAVPKRVIPEQKPFVYNRPIQNSYPAVRGYDD